MGTDKDEDDLAEVNRVVDEIARQIRQEQPETVAQDDPEDSAVLRAVAEAVGDSPEGEPEALSSLLAEDVLSAEVLDATLDETDFQQLLEDITPLDSTEKVDDSLSGDPISEASEAGETRDSGIGALLSMFKPGAKDPDVKEAGAQEAGQEEVARPVTEIVPETPVLAAEDHDLSEAESISKGVRNTDYREIRHGDINYNVSDVLNLPLLQQTPLQGFADFAEELPLHFPMNQFRVAVHGNEDDFADALAETRSSAANINILLRYAEALQAEQREDFAGSVRMLDELGRPALDNPSMRYDLARIAERAGDLAKAREEYQTLIGISDDVEMQQLSLVRLIDLAHQSNDNQAVPTLLRQLCGRISSSEQTKVLPRFYSFAEQIRDHDNRRWLLENLLELNIFRDDSHLLEQSVKLAKHRGDDDERLALLIRLCNVVEGMPRIKPLQQLLALYERREDHDGVDNTLRRLWHTAEEAGARKVLLETLFRLHDRDAEDSDVLLAMAACQREVEDSPALIKTLQTLSLVTDSTTVRYETLSELIELYEAAGDFAAADEVVLRLLKDSDDALERISTRAGSCTGARQKYWYGILYEWSEAADAALMMKRAAEALLRHAIKDGDELSELTNLARLRAYGEQPVDRWLRIAHLARKHGNSGLLTDALDVLLADNEAQRDLLEERIEYHIAAGEYRAATGRFEALLTVTPERIAVITKLLDMPENALEAARETELCYELMGQVEEQSPERFIALERLRRLDPENPAHLHLLIAHYRSTQNQAALGNALMALQVLQAGSSQQIATLNEAIAHFAASDEQEAMDEAFEILLPLVNHPLERIARHVETCTGARRSKWFEQLRKYAATAGDIEHQLIGLEGLVECAGDIEREIGYLKAMLPLSTDQGDIWRQLLLRYRSAEGGETDYGHAKLEAMDKLIEYSMDAAEKAGLLRERVDAHIAAGETERAVERLSELSQISDQPNSVLQELLDLGGNLLTTEQRIDIHRELSRSGSSSERKKALNGLSLMLTEDERLFDSIDVLMQLRLMEQKGSTEMAALDAQIEALIPQISIAEGVVSHPKLMQQIKDDFGHIAEYTQQYYDYALSTAIEKQDKARLEAIMMGALKQDATWRSCLKLSEKQLLQALGLLKEAKGAKAIFQRFEQDAPSVRIRRYTTQFLAPIFEAEKNWPKAVLYWKNAAHAALEEKDSMAAVRIQLRLLALYRSLKMKTEAEEIVTTIAKLPESVANELGHYMIQPLEMYGVMQVRDGDSNMALAIFNRAVALRKAHQKMDHSAATLLGNLAELYLKLKNIDQAEQHFTQAISHLDMHPEPTAAIRQKREAYRARKRIIASHRELALLKSKG